MLVAAGLLVSPAYSVSTGPATAGGEFHEPSPNQVPAPSAYNTTPPCPPTSENNYDCELSASALPPPDVDNPELFLNSAYWPSEERPDIAVYAVGQYGYEYKGCSALLPHYCFLVDAEAVGYPVSHTPQVGDLWLAPCDDLVWMNEMSPAACSGKEGWYLGYVQEVFPEGSFIQSWGGSTTPADSGLAVSWMSGAMDMNTDFIGFFPPGQFPHASGYPCDGGVCPANTLPPAFLSTPPHVGEKFSVTEGNWSGLTPITYAYQWQLCDSNGNACSDIPEATSSSYTPTASDLGRVLAIVVTGTNKLESVASNPVRSARVLASVPGSGSHSEPRRRLRIENFKISSFLKRKRGQVRAVRFLRASYSLSAPGRVTLSIRHETSKYVKTAHGRHRRTVPELVLDMDLNGHTGLNVHVMPDKLPRGAYCATLTSSGQVSSSSAEECFSGT